MRHLCLLLVAAVILPVAANDTLATLGAGGLVPLKTSEIVLESEDLAISVHRIQVRYVFRNMGERNIDATVAFPLPQLDGGLVANEPIILPSSDPLNFVDFRVAVNGEPVRTQTEARAFQNDREITKELRSLGLPVSPLDSRLPGIFKQYPPDVRAQLHKSGWMQGCEPGDSECRPYWQLNVQFHWAQRFPAKSTVTVEHTYRPVVGGSYISPGEDGKTSVTPYCGGADALAAIQRMNALHAGDHGFEPLLRERRIEYILTTANNWSGPIRSFRLAIDSDSADDIVVTCMPGIRRVAPARYELVRSDFRPDRELEVLILQASRK